jgi:hypothetical protein
MTFLKLQNQLVQTRKHRRGISNRLDYYDDSNEYAFDATVYKKALQAANQVVKYYYETGEVSPQDKIKTEIHVKR